jgi:hypothetical protein
MKRPKTQTMMLIGEHRLTSDEQASGEQMNGLK